MSNKEYEKTVKKYRISIITPVHIGNGNKLSQIDFVLDDNTFWVIDIKKVISILHDNQKALNEFGQAGFDMKEFLNRYNISYSDVKKYSYKCTYPYLREISEFVKTGLGNPYIPGSSIKGALRTVILWHLMKDSPSHKIKSLLDQILNSKVEKRQADKMLNKEFFGKDPNYDFLRGLQVGDAEFMIEDIVVGETKVLSIENGKGYGWKKMGKDGFISKDPIRATSIFTEILTQKVTSDVMIRIENFLFDHPLAKEQLGFDNKKRYLTQLAQRCNEYAKEFIKDEIAFYKSCGMNKLKEFYEELIIQMPKNEDSFLLHLGWGSGWRGMTGNYLKGEMLQKFREKFRIGKSIKDPRTGRWQQFPVFPKTRKIVFKNNQPTYPLGWVKIFV